MGGRTGMGADAVGGAMTGAETERVSVEEVVDVAAGEVDFAAAAKKHCGGGGGGRRGRWLG